MNLYPEKTKSLKTDNPLGYPEKVCKVLKVLHNNKREGYYDLKLLFPDKTEHRVYLGTELCERINRKELKIRKEETIILTNYHEWYSSHGLTPIEFINGTRKEQNRYWFIQDILKSVKPVINKKKKRLSLKDIVKRTRNIKLEDSSDE